jgi:hypothetical protein
VDAKNTWVAAVQFKHITNISSAFDSFTKDDALITPDTKTSRPDSPNLRSCEDLSMSRQSLYRYPKSKFDVSIVAIQAILLDASLYVPDNRIPVLSQDVAKYTSERSEQPLRHWRETF